MVKEESLNISSDLSVISPNSKIYEIDNRPQNEQPVKPVTYSVIKVGLIDLQDMCYLLGTK